MTIVMYLISTISVSVQKNREHADSTSDASGAALKTA
jgi:hypothetical protein